MAGKTGKHGHNTGKTVRSSYARTARRREGILVKKVRQSRENSEEIPAESLVETISYSLGKQNRWLMPEVIKTSENPREVFGEESDFVLVEQSGSQNGRRGRCISVYESSSGRIRKPRKRYGQVHSLRSDSSEVDLELEVQYPAGKGSWPLNSEVKYSEKCCGKSKRCSINRRGKRRVMVEVDGYFSDEDEYYNDVVEDNDNDGNDDDDDDGMYFEESSQDDSLYTFSLGDYLVNRDAKQPCIQREPSDKAFSGQQNHSFKNNVIIIEDKKLVDEHNRLAVNAKVHNALLMKELKPRRKRPRRKKKKSKK